jgi:hypothetical protein
VLVEEAAPVPVAVPTPAPTPAPVESAPEVKSVAPADPVATAAPTVEPTAAPTAAPTSTPTAEPTPFVAPAAEHVWIVPSAGPLDPALAKRGTLMTGLKPADAAQLLSGADATADGSYPPEVVTVPQQLAATQKAWRVYSPAPCPEPFARFHALTDDGSCAAATVPGEQLATDLAAPKPPELSWVVTEDPAAALEQITTSGAYAKTGLVVVLSDDGALLLSPLMRENEKAKGGALELLRTLSDGFAVSPLGRAAEAKPLGKSVYR